MRRVLSVCTSSPRMICGQQLRRHSDLTHDVVVAVGVSGLGVTQASPVRVEPDSSGLAERAVGVVVERVVLVLADQGVVERVADRLVRRPQVEHEREQVEVEQQGDEL